MSMFFSEASWLCVAVTAALGSMVLCQRKSPGQLGSQMAWLAGLWGTAYLLLLPLFWCLVLFSLSCFLLCVSSTDQELLPVDQKAVLVTGCDSGFGHALVKDLDKLGFIVFAGVLNEKGPGAEELRRTCSQNVSVLQMDITNPEQIQDAHRQVVEKVQDKGLWALVNNAGIFGFPIDGELIPMTEYRKCMAVNFFGPVEVTKAFLPLLRKSKGRLVNVSSMGGGVPLPKLAAYNSTKAALTMFSSIMRQELSKWGVRVSVIQPAGFKTSIAGTSDVWAQVEKNFLDHLSQELLRDYGQDYILLQKNFLSNINTQASPDFTPVLQDIRHAISAKSPAPFYAPGRMASQWLLFASICPTRLFDYTARTLAGLFFPRRRLHPHRKSAAERSQPHGDLSTALRGSRGSFHVSSCCFAWRCYVTDMVSVLRPHEPASASFHLFCRGFLSPPDLPELMRIRTLLCGDLGREELCGPPRDLTLSPDPPRLFVLLVIVCSLEKHLHLPPPAFPPHSQLGCLVRQASFQPHAVFDMASS
ncbi:17-beta-hydroxysteroid dehydrogenase type 2 [Ctenodactylus gundi]